jgi:hypothetical protein
LQKDGEYTLSEPYADDGRRLAASTVAVYHNNQLLIGTVFDKLMICHVPNVDLV